ncbi:MAG: lysophospholipid acyltransferase family protein [bacterium]
MGKPVQKIQDLFVTTVLWIYFVFGFLVLYFPFYLANFPFAVTRELNYQRLHHLFFKRFFGLTQFLIPSLSFEIDKGVDEIRSSIIVCNHISYLDPLLLISLYEKQKTIVKSSFFRVPLFGWLIRQSGYVSAGGKGISPWQVMDRILRLGDYLSTGGNIFVFPEGTRSRDGKIGRLSRGAFEIALRSRAPVMVLFVENSNRLFKPGRFLFNAAIDQPIRLKWIGSLNPDYEGENFSVQELTVTVQKMFEAENDRLGVNHI